MENKLHIELLAKIVGAPVEGLMTPLVRKNQASITVTEALTALQALETALTEKHRAEVTELKERNNLLENAAYESAFYQNELKEFKARYEPDVCPTCGFKNGEHDNACN